MLFTPGGAVAARTMHDVRMLHIRRIDVEKYGPTRGGPVCPKVTKGVYPLALWSHTSFES